MKLVTVLPSRATQGPRLGCNTIGQQTDAMVKNLQALDKLVKVLYGAG